VPRIKALSSLVSVVAAFVFLSCAPSGFSRPRPATGVLSGSVKSTEGKPLEGIGVSARSATETFTTTVYTDESGRYSFPPLASGEYKVWAQAVGFDTSKSDAALSDGSKKQVDLTLAALSDFHKQLSGTEWAASLPENSYLDRYLADVS